MNISNAYIGERYLSLLLFVGKNKKKEFRSLKERVWNRLVSWNNKQLSYARKDVLQSVAQATLIFAISCFKLPVTFLGELNAMMARFWWGSMGEKKKIHWKALRVSKKDGGWVLGIFKLSTWQCLGSSGDV